VPNQVRIAVAEKESSGGDKKIGCVALASRYTAAMVKSKQVQLELELKSWGGKRRGAGRKRVRERATTSHDARPQLKSYNPVLITMRVCDDVPDLRQRPCWAVIVRTLRDVRGRIPMRFVHYSVLANHLHFIAEGEGREAVARGMQSFTARLAKRINRCFDRTGKVFVSRYHARELKTPREVWFALRYVLLNARHHGLENGDALPSGCVDPRSSGAVFDGWVRPPAVPVQWDFGTSPARTWLLRVGWRRYGLLDLDDTPGRDVGMKRAA
jgi:putative transposase